MGNIFSGSEIVEIGIQIEKNGRDFYNTAAARSKDKKAKEVFIFLAGEEEKHIIVFDGILADTGSYAPAESYPGEYFAYMNSIASEYIFTQKDKGAKIAEKTKDDRQAIDLGIGFEKDSIIFYEGIKKVVPEYDIKVIDKLIAQEENHLEMLTGLKHKL